MSISPRSGAMELKRLPCVKQYNILKQESRLTLGLNAARKTDYMKKIEVKVVENSTSYKKFVSAHVYLNQSGAKKFKRLPCLKYYLAHVTIFLKKTTWNFHKNFEGILNEIPEEF